jgi:hypothetical protein
MNKNKLLNYCVLILMTASLGFLSATSSSACPGANGAAGKACGGACKASAGAPAGEGSQCSEHAKRGQCAGRTAAADARTGEGKGHSCPHMRSGSTSSTEQGSGTPAATSKETES